MTSLASSVGTRYMFVGKLYEKRPSYRILGILMCIQLAVSAASWAFSDATKDPEGQPDSAPRSSASQQKAKVLRVRAATKPVNLACQSGLKLILFLPQRPLSMSSLCGEQSWVLVKTP